MSVYAVVVRDSNGTALGNIPVHFYWRDESQAGSEWIDWGVINMTSNSGSYKGQAWVSAPPTDPDTGLPVLNDVAVKAIAGGTGTDYQETESGNLTEYDERPSVATCISNGDKIDFPANSQPGYYGTVTLTNRTYTGSAQVVAQHSGTASGAYTFGYRAQTGITGSGDPVYESTTHWGTNNTSLSLTYPLLNGTGKYQILIKVAASGNYEAVDPEVVGTVQISNATGTVPTFNNSSVSATCSPTSATTSNAVNTGAFTAATAGHGGTLTYSLVSAKNSGGTSLSGWSVNSSNRTIGIPANTAAATYTCVVRVTETKQYYNDSTKDATITVTLSKRTPTLTLTGNPSNFTSTYNSGGTITAGGTKYGTVSASSGTTSVATVSTSGNTITVACVAAGSSVITVTAAATNFDNQVQATHTWTINKATGAAPTFAASSVQATLAPTSATVSPYRGTGNFTAATANHGGTIQYQIQSVTNSNGVSQTVNASSGWSINGSVGRTSSRIIRVPAQTAGGQTFNVVIRAYEAATTNYTESYTDAIITVTVNKANQPCTVTVASTGTSYTANQSGSVVTITYPNTDTLTASGYYGTLNSVTSGTTTVATCTNAAASTITSVGAGSSRITFNISSTDYSNEVARYVTITVARRDPSAAPTFSDQSKSVNLAPTAATTSPAVACSAFTAATAGHGGTITYSLVSVNGGGVGNWTVSTKRVITVPASTAGGTYAVVVRASEARTSTDAASSTDATITVTVNKATQDAPTATGASSTYNTSGYISGSATGGGGVGTKYFKADTAGGTNYGSATTSVSRNRNSVGTTTFIAYWAGNNYWAQSSNSNQASLVISKATPTLTFAAESGTLYYNRSTQTIGTVTYNGDGTAYYFVSTTNSVPAATATGWTAIANNGSVPSSAATATTYYVFLKSTAGTNYAAVNPKSGGSKAISKQTPVISTNPTKVSNWTYDKTAHNLLSGGAYKHSSSDTTAVAGTFAYAQATNAGSYTSLTWTFTPTDTTNYNTTTGSITGTVTVSPKGVTTQWGVLTWPYDGSTHSTTCGLVAGGVISGDTCTISLSGNSVGPNVGTATVTATLSNSNYTISSGGSSKTLTISQRTVTITAPSKTATSFTYTGSSQTLFNAGSCTTGGVMYYNTSNTRFSTSSWSTTFPDTSKTNAGTYTWFYYCYVSDTTNNTGTGINTSTSFSATINPATGSVGTVGTISAKTFSTSSQTVNLRLTGNTGTLTYSTSITVKNSSNTTISGWSCTSAGVVTIPASTTVGSYTVTGSVTCAASSDGNYAAVTTGQSRTWTVTINKADQAAPTATGGTNTYSTSGNVTGSASGGGGQGTLYYKSDTAGGTNYGTATTSVPTRARSSVGTTTFVAYWGGNTNYNASPNSNQASLVVNKATGSTGVATTAMTITYSATTGTRTVSGNTGTVSVSSSNTSVATVSISGSTITVTRKGYGSATITCTAAESTNYNQATSTFTVNCNKATGGVTISNANPTYGTSNNLATVSGATGTMYYRVGTSGSFSTTMPTASGRNAGSYTLYYYVAESTNYTAFGTSSSPKNLTVTVGQKTGSVTISNANPTYGTSNNLASVSNATGTMHYRVGTSGSFSTSIPTASGRNAGSYTLQYYIDASSDGNYTALGSSSSPQSLTVTVAKVSNQITVSPTSTKVFYRTNYTQKTITVSDYKGTVTAVSSDTSKITVSPASSTSGTFTVTYVAVGSATITFTDTSTNYATSTATCTVQAKQDSVTTYGNVSTPTVTQIANFPAGGVTLTASNMSTYFSASATQTLTWESGYTSSGTVTYSWTVTSGSVASLGTTISNAASRTINCTVTATGEGSKTNTKNVTSGTQVGNYVTAVQATSSNSSNLTAPHFSYANIGPGATLASPSLSGGAVYTFSSGSTAFANSGSPSFGGSASYSRVYTLGTVQNGFTAVNATSGVLTATSMGTTVTSARTSGTVTGVLTVTYTHASSYSAGGTVTSSTKSDTATCTQTANAITQVTVSVAANPIAYNGTTTVTVTATYTSGSSKDVTSELTPNASSGNRINASPTGIITIS